MCLLVSMGNCFQDHSRDSQRSGCSSLLCKLVEYLHTINTHPPVYSQSFLDYSIIRNTIQIAGILHYLGCHDKKKRSVYAQCRYNFVFLSSFKVWLNLWKQLPQILERWLHSWRSIIKFKQYYLSACNVPDIVRLEESKSGNSQHLLQENWSQTISEITGAATSPAELSLRH